MVTIRSFTVLDGLPSNNVEKFYVAPNGLMWIATWNGLCNYDGYRFNSFAAPLDVMHVLTSNRLQQLLPDGKGNVWLSTADNRLYMLSSDEGRYIDYNERLEVLGMKSFQVSSMQCLTNGAVWIYGKDGKNLRVQDGRHELIPTNSSKQELCRKVRLTPDGNEWLMGNETVKLYGTDKNIPMRGKELFLTDDGIVIVGKQLGIYDIKSGRLEKIALPEGVEEFKDAQHLSDGTIAIATGEAVYTFKSRRFKKICSLNDRDIHKDSKDRLWSITADGTVMMVDIKKGLSRSLQISLPPYIKSCSDINMLHEDINGTMWALIAGKTIYYFDESSEELVPVDLYRLGLSPTKNFSIKKATADGQQNIWFSSIYSTGILSFVNNNFRFIPIAEDCEVSSVTSDHYGRYWVSTTEGQIALLNDKGETAGWLSADGAVSKTSSARFANDNITSTFEDSRQRVWITTQNGGLYLLSQKNDNSHYSVEHLTMENNQTPSNKFLMVSEDATGRIWLATKDAGVVYLDESHGLRFVAPLKDKRFVHLKEQYSYVRNISHAPDGTVVFSTAGGMLTINPKFSKLEEMKIFATGSSPVDNASLMSSDVYFTLPCRKSTNCIVATLGGGLQTMSGERYDADNLKFHQTFSRNISDKLGNVCGMTEDGKGRIWILGESVILCKSPEDDSPRTFPTDSWEHPVMFTATNPCVNGKSGDIMLGAMGGVVMFNPDNIPQTQFKPAIIFSGVLFQGEESITPLIGNKELVLPVNKHNAIVYFSALDYCDNDFIRYAYRIKELSDDWIFVGNEHCASLSNMPPGHYTLEVRSTNSDGTWMDNNAELRINVEPTLWQTPWAWLLYLLFGGALLYGIVYLLWLRNAHRMEKRMKEQQLRFFTDISHQLRTPLTLIGGPVSEVLNTETLSETASTYLRYVESNTNKMLQLVNKTLDWNKLQELNEDVETPSPSSLNLSDSVLFPAASSQGISDLTILVVEDNDELRHFLSSTLSTHYNIIEAENGKAGLSIAAKHQPDFIITDIMMPEMDGITMIRNIKQDRNICHIPIIILSARTADVYRIEGLKEGADDYITKPFSVSYLQVRVESIVRQRRLLQEEWRNSFAHGEEASPDNETLTKPTNEMTSIDKIFIESFNKFVNENYPNADLKIDDIANALGISRSVLYGKIKSIYGLTPSDILRNKRTACAYQMLKTDYQKNISEISYACGFGDPKYFGKVFKQAYGITPTDLRKAVAAEGGK